MSEVEVTFRGITFNNNFTLGSDLYMLFNIPEGFSHPVIRESEQDIQGDHGISDQNSFYGRRLITLTGKILSTSQVNRKTMENNLRAIFCLDGIQTDLNASYYPLYFLDEDGIAKQIEVKVSTGIEFTKEAGSYAERDFIVTLKARDPRIYSQALHEQIIEEFYAASGFQLPTKLPVLFDPIQFNAETIANAGNFSSPPIITFTGESINPGIRNVTTGQQMVLNTTLNSGETIVINVSLGTIEKDGIDISSTLDPSSEWLYIAPGNNELQVFDSTPAALTLTAKVEWRDAYI